MSGWELLQKLRQRTTEHMPIILCSSMLAVPPADFPKTLQFDGTLLKPVSTEQLLTEPPRIWWRHQHLREWCHEQEAKEIFS